VTTLSWNHGKGKVPFSPAGCFPGRGSPQSIGLQTLGLLNDSIATPPIFRAGLIKMRGTTVDILMRFAREGRTFDFVYVDADHRFDGVLLDTILSWPLLRKGGYLVDDYLWTHPAVPHLNPKRVIDAWLASCRDSIDVVFAGHQVCVQKIADDRQITDMAYWNELPFDHVQSSQYHQQ
jgi:Methyltransferase domain